MSDTPEKNNELADKEKKKSAFVKALKGLFVIFVLMMIVGHFAKDDKTTDDPTAPFETRIASIDERITKVDIWPQADGSRVIYIFYDPKIVLKPVYTIGMETQKIAEKVVKRNIVDANTHLLFFVHVPTQDKYGNKGKSLGMKILWAGQTLTQINWSNMHAPGWLNLASSVELRPVMHQSFNEFAMDPDYQQQCPNFIRLALQR